VQLVSDKQKSVEQLARHQGKPGKSFKEPTIYPLPHTPASRKIKILAPSAYHRMQIGLHRFDLRWRDLIEVEQSCIEPGGVEVLEAWGPPPGGIHLAQALCWEAPLSSGPIGKALE